MSELNMREEFEKWFSNNGEHPKAVERSGDGYILMQADSSWLTWQAAWNRRAPEAGQTLSLDERMREAGMISVADMLAGTPIDKFVAHTGVKDLASFEEWLINCRVSHYRMQARFELNNMQGDDMYEWYVAHNAVFHEVLVNFRAAKPQAQAEPNLAQCPCGWSGSVSELQNGNCPRCNPQPAEGQEPVADEAALSNMNAALCDFYRRWKSDGDYLRCAKCKRAHIASKADQRFVHAAYCEAESTAEDFPWQVLIRLLRPLYAQPQTQGSKLTPEQVEPAKESLLNKCVERFHQELAQPQRPAEFIEVDGIRVDTEWVRRMRGQYDVMDIKLQKLEEQNQRPAVPDGWCVSQLDDFSKSLLIVGPRNERVILNETDRGGLIVLYELLRAMLTAAPAPERPS